MSAPALLVTAAETARVQVEDTTHPTRVWEQTTGDVHEVHATYATTTQARVAALTLGARSTLGRRFPISIPVDPHTRIVVHDRPRGTHRLEVR